MRFDVESWSPEYGAPVDPDALQPSEAVVNLDVELPHDRWRPIDPRDSVRPRSVLFVDGIRRIDARVWIVGEEAVHPGLCASYAAGTLRSEGEAVIERCEIRRALIAAWPAEPIVAGQVRYEPRIAAGDEATNLLQSLQQRLRELEVEVTREALPADLVVVDGPLRDRQDVAGAVGFIKTHQVQYLTDAPGEIVPRLTAGQRTPLFVTQTSWSRYSWYLRLPCEARHPWAGVVRCEASAELEVEDAAALADRCAVALGRFASEPFKDPRAPQNLYPIGGLERELRRRLGDAQLLYRMLRVAAGATSALSGDAAGAASRATTGKAAGAAATATTGPAAAAEGWPTRSPDPGAGTP